MENSGKSPKKEILNREESNLKFDDEQELKEISIEELKELNQDLAKAIDQVDKDELKVKGLLNIIRTIQVSLQQLFESKIGKSISKLVDQSKQNKYSDPSILEISENILNRWKKQNEKQKKEKKEEISSDVKLPYIPRELKKKIENGLVSSTKVIALKFIELLQTHPDFQTKQVKHSSGAIIKAAEVGLSIAEYLVAAFGHDKVVLQKRFRTLVTSLSMANPRLRLTLLSESIHASQFVQMEEKELASEEVKKRAAEEAEFEMQKQRSDLFQEQEIKKAINSEMYSCKKCKSKQVTCRTMQTRGADEPMTEFYNCLACKHSWKNCP